MKMMDSAAYAAARRYARANVVTARVDELEFHQPIMIGDLVVCTADISFVGHSSMEVMVNVTVEDLQHSSKPQHALSAYFTMVALDRNMRPLALKPLVLDSDEARGFFEVVQTVAVAGVSDGLRSEDGVNFKEDALDDGEEGLNLHDGNLR